MEEKSTSDLRKRLKIQQFLAVLLSERNDARTHDVETFRENADSPEKASTELGKEKIQSIPRSLHLSLRV